ncbi:MAG: DNA-directed RNA polymerase subunit E'' [Nanoarchaeota archaeon]|nr:DNA-directed RNA polymerase subunit E'' [Nanoarchaeota archaeon]MBU1705004.1 DNA-directed RNA polymerase subunit E'' [Nanoarchaeota archaeon]
MKKKVCRECKFFYEGEKCPACGSNKTATTWQGRIHVLDTQKSSIAKKIGITVPGEYAIKTR